MELCPHDHLVHAGSRSHQLEVVHPLARLTSTRLDRDGAQGVQAVGVHPEVGVRDSDAPRPGIVEPRDRLVDPAVCAVDESDATRGEALPARVRQLATEREGGLERRAGLIDVSQFEVRRREQRLWMRQEGDPSGAAAELDGASRAGPCLIKFLAQQMAACQEGQRPGFEARLVQDRRRYRGTR